MDPATKEKFAALSSGRRRWKEFDCPLVGPMLIRSITAGEFARVDAARSRASIACLGKGKPKDQIRALCDGLVELLILAAYDLDKNPLFDAMDRATLLSLDTAVSDPLVTACIEHCGIDEANLDESKKNSPETSGENLPTGCGSD